MEYWSTGVVEYCVTSLSDSTSTAGRTAKTFLTCGCINSSKGPLARLRQRGIAWTRSVQELSETALLHHSNTPLLRYSTTPFRRSPWLFLHVESEFHHVSVLDDILFSFDTELACFSGFRK
jgi:hypothetical protein